MAVQGVAFVMAGFGHGCNGGQIIARAAIIAIENPYADAPDRYYFPISQMTHEKSEKYKIIGKDEYEALRKELSHVVAKCVATTHDGGPDWPDCYAGSFAWLLVLPDGRCIGLLQADMNGYGETLLLRDLGSV
jgi:hypothetical protein